MALSPEDIPAALRDAMHEHKAGNIQKAVEIYRAVLGVEQGRHDVRHLVAIVECQRGRFDAALLAIDQALVLSNRQAAYYFTRGQALQGLRRHAEAVESFNISIQLNTNVAEAHHSLAIALQDIGHLDEAVNSFNAAIDINPNHARANYNLAVVQQSLGRFDEAAASFQKAIEIKPEYFEAWYRRGILLAGKNRLNEAENCLRQALHIRPGQVDAQLQLGKLLERMCRLPEAIKTYRSALASRPDSADILNNLGNALTNHCDLGEAISVFRSAVRLSPDDHQIHSNMLVCLNYSESCSNDMIFAEHLNWARLHARPLDGDRQGPAGLMDSERRLRVGYVSPSFDSGAVPYFLRPLLQNHDRNQVEVFAYNTRIAPDSLPAETPLLTDNWREAGDFGPVDLAKQIASDAIDVLVDLSGHTPGHRLLTFACKPAPIQVSWLDYFNTTGLDCMDYLISDQVHTPDGTTQKFTEQLAFLPDCRLCYAPASNAPEVVAPPSLRNGAVTFGSFNRLSKLTPAGVALWSNLLRTLPDAKLILKSNSLSDPGSWPEYWSWFENHGIERRRVELRPASPHTQMLFEYGDIDIALDPFPYNGGLTTCEALWMGVPVIALRGDRMIACQSAALLTAAGLEQFIAATPEEYISIAKALAKDPAVLAGLRKTQRARMAASPLCNGKKFAHDMEHLYRTMWRKYCADMPPNNPQHS